jgi:hypothetical protein
MNRLLNMFEAALNRYLKWAVARHKSDLEAFLESKNAKSSVEIEYWIREYTYKRGYF